MSGNDERVIPVIREEENGERSLYLCDTTTLEPARTRWVINRERIIFAFMFVCAVKIITFSKGMSILMLVFSSLYYSLVIILVSLDWSVMDGPRNFLDNIKGRFVGTPRRGRVYNTTTRRRRRRRKSWRLNK